MNQKQRRSDGGYAKLKGKNICLLFQLHKALFLKKYRFFDIGNDPYYYDDFENERMVRQASEDFYLPLNEMLLSLFKKYDGLFKISFSISGTLIDLFELYTPEVIKSFKTLVSTGCVDFFAETYSYSLASLKNKAEFYNQTKEHFNKIEKLFGQSPIIFKNTGQIYSDVISMAVADMGFRGIITDIPRKIVKSGPHFIYSNPVSPHLSIFLKDYILSDDFIKVMNQDGKNSMISNFIIKLNKIAEEQNVINLLIDLEAVRGFVKKGGEVFLNFLNMLPSAVLGMTDYVFNSPTDMVKKYIPDYEISIPEPISSSSYEGGFLSRWMGNELQKEAIEKLYAVREEIQTCTDSYLLKDWLYLQSADHFYFMCSKFFSGNGKSPLGNPYNNPYEAFMNYMNILNDFTLRLKKSNKKEFNKIKKGKPVEVME